MKIDEQTAAVVTGGGSGLGKASAEALAGAGIRVAIFDLNEETGKQVADSIGGVFCKTNVLDEESVLESFDQARKAQGKSEFWSIVPQRPSHPRRLSIWIERPGNLPGNRPRTTHLPLKAS